MVRSILCLLACVCMAMPVFAEDEPKKDDKKSKKQSRWGKQEEPPKATAPAAEITDPGADKIRIGTWNIENFGSRGRRDQDVDAIASYIKELKVDLLGLQEINGATPLTKLTKHLGPDWSYLIGSTGKFGRKQIGVGFLWNTKRLKLVQAEELLELPRRKGKLYLFHRKPVVGVFKAVQGGLDFRAVVVHFKAGKLNQGRKWQASSNKRQAETEILGAHIEALLKKDGEDQDLIVMGDYNHDPSYPCAKVFSKYVTYQKPVTAHHSIFYFNEQIDHFANSKGLDEEIVKGSCHVRYGKYEEDRKKWKKVYSDHIPVTIDLLSKDNDEATFSPIKDEQKLVPGKAKVEAPKKDPE